ncbi:hypothetical protein C1646_766664 [Rhizophagus diaphanus]|nr:hypothetical protein C1646_766664 [Rhizophagus diaphanus] [Rhizophagus sp. MUCL 43196]
MAKTLVEDSKWRVILLYSDGYSKKEIAKLLYIGKTLINKVLCEIVREHVDFYFDEYIEEMQVRTGKRVSRAPDESSQPGSTYESSRVESSLIQEFSITLGESAGSSTRTYSSVWSHFTLVENDEKAQCNYCG